MRTFLSSIAIGALVLGGSAAQATPSTIIPGKEMGGKLGAKSQSGADGAPFDCYAIEVPAGTEFTVSMDASGFTPEVWIARGAQCDSVAMQAMSEPAEAGGAKVNFTSAGGRYLVFARGGSRGGTYKIKVESVTSPVAGESVAAVAGSPAEAGSPVEAGEEIDPRVALMNRQVTIRNAQIAEEQRIAAERERERQRQLALQRKREAEARARAEAEAQQSDEGGIFGRALGGFLMGAMLGGGGEGSMDMAIAGAQAAASGGNALEVINSIGSAVPSSGSSGGAMGGAMGSMSSAPVMPNTLAGSSACAGMNESNYRQVGLSGGGDTQMKTQCAMAYEYYNQYKNAVAEGYSAADTQRTYDAFQKTAMQVQQFQSETSGGTVIHQDTHGPQAPAQVQGGEQSTNSTSTCNSDGRSSCVTPQ